MTTRLLFLLLIHLPLFAISQDPPPYQKLIDKTKEWYVETQTDPGNGGVGFFFNYSVEWFGEDTLINGAVYTQLLSKRVGRNDPGLPIPADTLFKFADLPIDTLAYLREDALAQQVYVYVEGKVCQVNDSTTQNLTEMLLYDFGLGTGDTFATCYYGRFNGFGKERYLVDSTGVILLENGEEAEIFYSKSNVLAGWPPGNLYIEGIGRNLILESTVVPVGGYTIMRCVHKNGVPIYPTEGCPPVIITSNPSAITLPPWNLYPNPTTGQVILESPSDQSFPVEVVNLYGQTVLSTTSQKRTVLDLSNQADGVYIVRLFAKDGVIYEKIQRVRE